MKNNPVWKGSCHFVTQMENKTLWPGKQRLLPYIGLQSSSSSKNYTFQRVLETGISKTPPGAGLPALLLIVLGALLCLLQSCMLACLCLSRTLSRTARINSSEVHLENFVLVDSVLVQLLLDYFSQLNKVFHPFQLFIFPEMLFIQQCTQHFAVSRYIRERTMSAW